MSASIFHLHMRSLMELKQTGTVVEYTAAFWERLHRVLDLNSDLSVKCFVDHYVQGLRDDIQAAVRARSPSSITGASCLARIREDEIVEDVARGADKLGDSYGLMPTESRTDVFAELAVSVQCRAGHDITTIDDSGRGARTPTTCSTECPSSDATVGVFPKLAVSAESDEDVDTVSIAPLKPTACSTGGLAKVIVPETGGCIIMAPTRCSALCLHDNNDKHITAQVPVLAPTACPHPAPDRNLCASGVPRPRPWPSFVSDGDGERLTYSGPATQGIWPCLQLKPAWLYSAHALLSKRPRCQELLYVNGNLKLLARYWKSSSPKLPGNDWFCGYSVTDLVVQKNWDPGIIQWPFLNNINLHGTHEVKFLWVLSMRRYAAYNTDNTFGSKCASFKNDVSIGIKHEAEYETMLYFFTVSAQLQDIVQIVMSLIGSFTQLEALQSACSRYPIPVSCSAFTENFSVSCRYVVSLRCSSELMPPEKKPRFQNSVSSGYEKHWHIRWFSYARQSGGQILVNGHYVVFLSLLKEWNFSKDLSAVGATCENLLSRPSPDSFYCMQTWCLRRTELIQQQIRHWNSCSVCPTTLYARTLCRLARWDPGGQICSLGQLLRQNLRLTKDKQMHTICRILVLTRGHGSELYPGIKNRVCRATRQISAALYKSGVSAIPVNNGVTNYLAHSIASIIATGWRASAYMQMFVIVDIWPSPELPCGTHHDHDLILLDSTHHKWIFKDSFFEYDGGLDRRGYADVATGCWSALVVRQVQTPWDPGGFAVHWHLITGLRTSRILRGRECHAPRIIPVFSHWALLLKVIWPLGWAQLQKCESVLIYEEAKTRGGHRRNESSVTFSPLALFPHLLLLFPHLHASAISHPNLFVSSACTRLLVLNQLFVTSL